MLCDNCHQREATCHVTNCTNVSGDVPTTGNLCSECFGAAAPVMAQELSSAFQAGCQYCGSEPDCSAPDLSAGLRGKHQIRALCKRCAQECYGFVNRKLPGLGKAKM